MSTSPLSFFTTAAAATAAATSRRVSADTPSSWSSFYSSLQFSSFSRARSVSSVSSPSGSRRFKSSCPCVFYNLKVRAMAELVQDKESAERAVSASGFSEKEEKQKKKEKVSGSRTFLDARSGEELLVGIRKEAAAKRLPLHIAMALEELYNNFRNAVFLSGSPRAEEIVLSNMAVAFDRILLDVEDPFVFSPYHKALREPFDYYMFGQNLIRPLIDFKSSYIGNISLFREMGEKLQQGHNIVLISNHQTEADPAVIAVLLERTNPLIAESMTYVAGDRVITDPLCKPFSMGRNLICVYSKKHMNDDPKLVEVKRKANTRSLKEMAVLLRYIHGMLVEYCRPPSGQESRNLKGGSQIVWIAPSGGRDRPDPHTQECCPAPFDTASVDNMRRLTENSSAPGHLYPLALLCYDIMPPPPQVEKEIGERRVVSFHGVGLSVAPEISFPAIAAACEKPEEAKEAYTQAMYNSVTEQYNVLKSAIHGKQGLEASIPTVSLSQPWT